MATNNQNTYNRSLPDPYQLIRKAVQLIEDPLSSDYVDRHVSIIDDFLSASTYAICVYDVPYVIKLFYLFSERINTIPQYRECFMRLLHFCQIPPMLTKTSEVLTFAEDMREYFSVFGYLLVELRDDEIFDLILQILKNFFSKKEIGICCINVRARNEALAESTLPDTVSELICIVDEETYCKLLETIEYLLGSDNTCKRFICHGMPNIILMRMYSEYNTVTSKIPDGTQPLSNNIPSHFDLSMRILWKLLNIVEKNANICSDKLITPEAWRSVHRFLRVLSALKMKKQKRNNLVTLILFILKLTGVNITYEIADDLALLCSASEVGTGGTWASEVAFMQDVVDYNFKKLLLLIIAYYPQNPNITKFLRQRKIVLCILRIITPEVELTWNEKQRCKLMRYSLLTLCEIMDVVFDDFLRHNGPKRLLRMAESFIKFQIRQCALTACLHCIYKSLSIKGKDISDKYRERNGFDILIELLKYFINLNIISTQMQHCVVCSFCILEIINRQHEYSRDDVIETCFMYLKRFLKASKCDLPYNLKVIITCLDFLWENLTWSTFNFQYFIKNGGTYLLLDIIEFSCFPIQLIALSILVDLCEEGSCIPYLLTWRGHNITAVPLLLKLFRNENKQIGVKATDKGIVADIELPLMGQKQFQLTYRRIKDTNSSPSTIDMLGSCRPKVYALLHLLNCNKAEIVEAVNERYKISSQPLTINDKITKLLAENYLPLKFGEAWVELKRDLEVAGIRPLIYDLETISTLIRRFYKWSSHIRKAQEELVLQEKQQEIIEEKMLYNRLREVRLSESLDALDDLRYIARCTENMFRLMAKMKQKDQLRRTLDYDPEFYMKFHMTFLHALSVTPVFNQKVNVRSNVIVEPSHQAIILEPVSPTDSVTEDKARLKARSLLYEKKNLSLMSSPSLNN